MSNEGVRSLQLVWNNGKTDVDGVVQSYLSVPSLAREQRNEIDEMVGRVLKLNNVTEGKRINATWTNRRRNVYQFNEEELLQQPIPIYQISNDDDIILRDCINFNDVYISSSDDDTDGEMISSEENDDTTDDDDFISSEDEDVNHSEEEEYDDFTFQLTTSEMEAESKVSDWLSCLPDEQTDINENVVISQDWSTENFEEACAKPEGWDIRSQPNSIDKLSFIHLLHSFEKPVSCQITYVDTQLKFYVARMDVMALYDKMTEDLQDIANKLKEEGMQLKNFVSGTPCIARYAEDDQYYRGVIASNGYDSASVVFIDYGNHAIVDYEDLLGLPESLADLPAMALECALDGVDSKKFPSADLIGRFQDDFYEGREVMVKAVSPMNLYDEYEIRWFVGLFDYETFELLNESYCPLKKVALVKECVVYDDDDETLVDGDTLVDVD